MDYWSSVSVNSILDKKNRVNCLSSSAIEAFTRKQRGVLNFWLRSRGSNWVTRRVAFINSLVLSRIAIGIQHRKSWRALIPRQLPGFIAKCRPPLSQWTIPLRTVIPPPFACYRTLSRQSIAVDCSNEISKGIAYQCRHGNPNSSTSARWLKVSRQQHSAPDTVANWVRSSLLDPQCMELRDVQKKKLYF